MNVLMIIPELTTGGAQRSFSQLAIDLSSRHNVELVVFNSIPLTYQLNLPVHSLDVKAGRSFLEKMIMFYKRISRLKKLKRKIKPSVSISFLEGADYINILSSIGERVIISIRGSKEFDQDISGVVGWIRKKLLIPILYKKAFKIIAVSYNLMDELNKNYGIHAAKLQTIHNYYDLAKLNSKVLEPLPAIFSSWLSGKILMNVGRLHNQKNQEFLIDIFPKIYQKHSDTKLVIIGDGKLRNILLEKARATGIKTYSVWDDAFSDDYGVYFLGEQLNPFPFLSRANIFVFPSLYEGFPNVLIEAMISGLPVISADCNYGPKEILCDEVENKYGVLLPLNPDIEKLKNIWIDEIFQKLNDQTQLHLYSEAGKKRVNEFSREKILNLWMSTIEGDD